MLPSGEKARNRQCLPWPLSWCLLCQHHQIHPWSQNWGCPVCPFWPLCTVKSRASKHQGVQSMLLWTRTESPACLLTWRHTLEVEGWAGSRRLSKLEVVKCDLKLMPIAVESVWRFFLGHLILPVDFVKCSKVQKETSMIPAWQLKVVLLKHLLDWLSPKLLWLATSFQQLSSGAKVPCSSNAWVFQHLDETRLHALQMNPSTNTWECELGAPNKE